MNRYARRKDVVHTPIVNGLRAMGVIVFDMPTPGDILCYIPAADRWMPLELKSGNDIRKKAKVGGDSISNNKPKDPAFAIIPVAHSLNEALSLLKLGVTA